LLLGVLDALDADFTSAISWASPDMAIELLRVVARTTRKASELQVIRERA
jgi:hypothetical protein